MVLLGEPYTKNQTCSVDVQIRALSSNMSTVASVLSFEKKINI